MSSQGMLGRTLRRTAVHRSFAPAAPTASARPGRSRSVAVAIAATCESVAGRLCVVCARL